MTSIADALGIAVRCVQNGCVRSDASGDRGLTLEGGLGAFWQGMVDWVDGTRTIEEVFADIDAKGAALPP